MTTDLFFQLPCFYQNVRKVQSVADPAPADRVANQCSQTFFFFPNFLFSPDYLVLTILPGYSRSTTLNYEYCVGRDGDADGRLLCIVRGLAISNPQYSVGSADRALRGSLPACCGDAVSESCRASLVPASHGTRRSRRLATSRPK